jgi:aminoacrylate hydrolase
VNGIELFFDDVGRGVPVMLITGLGGVGSEWGAQIDFFGAQFRAIVPDHRGRGRSTITKTGHTYRQLARDMAACLRACTDRPAHLVGSSAGGVIAQLMALDHPDVVASLTITSSFSREDEYSRRWLAFRLALLERGSVDDNVALNMLLLFSAEHIRTHGVELADLERVMRAAPFDREIAVARLNMVRELDHHRRLHEIGVPTLVLAGADDFLTPVYLSRDMAAEIPGAVLEVVPGAGHLVFAERPERFFDIVSTFIANAEAKR